MATKILSEQEIARARREDWADNDQASRLINSHEALRVELARVNAAFYASNRAIEDLERVIFTLRVSE